MEIRLHYTQLTSSTLKDISSRKSMAQPTKLRLQEICGRKLLRCASDFTNLRNFAISDI